MKILYAAYNEIGEVVGLYNSEHHTVANIPATNIQISQAQHAALCRRPNDFRVNVSLRQLVDSGASLSLVDSSDNMTGTIAFARVPHEAGFIYKGTCYFADDVSSAHITQCLVISMQDKEYKATLKISVGGVPEFKTVNAKDLIEIAKGVNQLRSNS